MFRVKVEIMSVNLTLEDSNRLRGICSPITHSKRMLSLVAGEQQPWNSNPKCQACAEAIRKMKVRSNRAEVSGSPVSAKLHLLHLCHLTTPVYSNTVPSVSTELSAPFKRSTCQTAGIMLSDTESIFFNKFGHSWLFLSFKVQFSISQPFNVNLEPC